ncbi:MAG: hypothetical protein C0483_04765 [Pirellula sp.]|nr:hypothetical protein [Pirellula sp.]
MSTITPHYRTVKDLLQSQSFSIDEYQREYKWEQKNIEELLSDLRDKFISSYQPGHETTKVNDYEDYFLGSIIVSKRGGKRFLVDGQQRVTSLTLLLIYLYRAAEEQELPVKSSLAPLIYSDSFGKPRFNLDIVERLPVIEALFKGEEFTPDGKEESIQTMYARYQDIERIDPADEFKEALPHFIYWLMNKVGLIEIATDNDNYAYAIFETMNDRGKPLSPVDMLKAYLLAPIEDEDKRRNANQVWKKQVLELISWQGEHEAERDANCIKAWLRAQYAESIRDRKAGATDKDWELIGTTFHRWVRDNQARLKVGGESQNLALITQKFPFFSKAYLTIYDASHTYTPGLEAVFYNAHNEFTWQNTVLLAPLTSEDSDDVVRRKLAVTATFLDIWLMRRTTNYIRVGYSSASYTMYLLCKDIRGKSLPDLVQTLFDKLSQDDVTFDGSTQKGRTGIGELGLNQFSRKYIYHMLARIAAYVDLGAGRPDLFDKYVDRDCKNPCDIEHIWADDRSAYQADFATEQEFQDFRNHVAGLLLLPADVNRSYQAKPFQEKAPHYAKQNLYAASLTAGAYEHQPQFEQFRQAHGFAFKPYAQFGKNEQLERRELVKQLVKRIWSPERLKEYLT